MKGGAIMDIKDLLARGDVMIIIAIVVAILLITGAYFVGYRAADGTPDVINLTDKQTNDIINEQDRACDKTIKTETRALKDTISEKDDMIEKLNNYRNVIIASINTQSTKITDLKNVIVDLNTTIADLNC